jgi:hypothetical protein
VADDHEFEREHGCTETDWLRCLPGAVGAHVLTFLGPSQAHVALGDSGALSLAWAVLAERRIALMRLPRLHVHYRFDASLSADERERFMRGFDLYMHRGGG